MGRYADACAAFEESQRLDPQPTTLFNIALCDEQLGKLASALAIYTQLVDDDTPARRAKSADMLGQLSVRVPRLEIVIANPRPGTEVTVNGVRAPEWKNLPVDLGVNRISVRAPGASPWSGEVTAKAEGQRLSIAVTLEIQEPGAPRDAGAPEPRPAVSALSAREKLGLVLMIGGGAAIGGGITFGLLARSAWHDAKDVCGGTTCETKAQLDAGQVLVERARTRGTIATALVLAGGAIAAGGVLVWVTAPAAERKLAVAPTGSASALGLVVLGTF